MFLQCRTRIHPAESERIIFLVLLRYESMMGCEPNQRGLVYAVEAFGCPYGPLLPTHVVQVGGLVVGDLRLQVLNLHQPQVAPSFQRHGADAHLGSLHGDL